MWPSDRFPRDEQLAADGLNGKPSGRFVDHRQITPVFAACDRKFVFAVDDLNRLTAVGQCEPVALGDLRARWQACIELGEFFGQQVLHETPGVICALLRRAQFVTNIGILTQPLANIVTRLDDFDIASKLLQQQRTLVGR